MNEVLISSGTFIGLQVKAQEKHCRNKLVFVLAVTSLLSFNAYGCSGFVRPVAKQKCRRRASIRIGRERSSTGIGSADIIQVISIGKTMNNLKTNVDPLVQRIFYTYAKWYSHSHSSRTSSRFLPR